MPGDNRPTVYSTDPGFKKRCKRCNSYPCRCPKPRSLPPANQVASIQREVKGRGGKTVTVVRGLVLSQDDIKALASTLKTTCGSGGTVKGDTIEIQGDHRETISAKLQSMGYKTKFTGG